MQNKVKLFLARENSLMREILMVIHSYLGGPLRSLSFRKETNRLEETDSLVSDIVVGFDDS